MGQPDLSMFEDKPHIMMHLTFHVPETEFDASEFSPGAQVTRHRFLRNIMVVTETGRYEIGNITFPDTNMELELDGDFFENVHFVKLEVIR